MSTVFQTRITHVVYKSYMRDLENWCRQNEGVMALARTALVLVMLIWVVAT